MRSDRQTLRSNTDPGRLYGCPAVHTPTEEKQTKRDLENRGKSGQSEPHSDTHEPTIPDLPDKMKIEKEETQRKEKETESQTGDKMRGSYQEPYEKTARYLVKERS